MSSKRQIIFIAAITLLLLFSFTVIADGETKEVALVITYSDGTTHTRNADSEETVCSSLSASRKNTVSAQSAAGGVGDYTPGDRSVEGLAWSGFDDNFNPTVQPPVKTFEEIEDELTPPQPAEIPEPATLLLVGSGIAGLAAYARRHRNA